MRVSVLVLLLALVTVITAHAETLVQDGVIDLSERPLADSGIVELRGNWEFYWQAFHKPFDSRPSNRLWIQSPGTWEQQEHVQLTNHGYGTYRLKLRLAEEDVGQTLGIHIPGIASAYDLYMNDELLHTNGRIGTSSSTMKASAVPQTLYYTAYDNKLELTLHVSNFVQRKGGIWAAMELGTAQQISQKHDQRIAFEAAIAIGLFIMGIYHIALYFFLSAKSTLYFGLTCLLLFFRMLFVGEVLAVRFLPEIPWEIGVKIEYLSVFWGIGFFLLYFYHLYSGAILAKRLTYSLFWLIIILSLPIFIWPARIYTEWMVPYQMMMLMLVLYIVYGVIVAVVLRKGAAWINLAASIIFLMCVLNDIFYYNFWFETIDLVTLGIFLFIFVQMFMLSKGFASAYNEVTVLKNKLIENNENLEQEVHLRTEALRATNEQLVKTEKARKDLLSNISHEISNPLTSIIGYLTAMRDGVSKESQDKHIQIAYDKAMRLKRMTDDLRQLVKLEHDQLTFDIRTIDLTELYQALQDVYDWEMIDRKMNIQLSLPADSRWRVKVDLDRMEQVFTNIINNAINHTHAGDDILIRGRCFRQAGCVVIEVRDSGIGVKKKDQVQLFDRFYRVKNIQSEQVDGTGLGLSICKTIIEKHHGRIGVRSVFGKGSVFYFILPLCKEEGE